MKVENEKWKTENGKLKILGKFFLAAGIFSGGLLFASCDTLQDSLSSEQKADLIEETGSASIEGKVWYYNGTASDDMSAASEKLGNDYFEQTLLVNFGKKVALDSLSGSISLTYTNKNKNLVTENYSTINGAFSQDYTGYKIDMSGVMRNFDTSSIPSGTAKLDLKIGGFKCAEESQKGRRISAFEAKNIKIQPFYNSTDYSFSTVNYSKATSKLVIPVNGSFSLENGSYKVTGTGSDSKNYTFNVSSESSQLILSPDFDTPPADGTTLDLLLTGILPQNAGDSYSKKISLSFTKYKIVIDGIKDANYEASDAVVSNDSTGDQSAFADFGHDVSSTCDINNVYVTSDDEYLYIGVGGSLAITWNDALSILVSNETATGGSGKGAEPSVKAADTEDFAAPSARAAKVRPNVYITHQPGFGGKDSASGAIAATAYVSASQSDISGVIKYAPQGWKISETGSFLEYAVPIGGLTGLNAGDNLKIIVVASLHWDDGNALSDACPDSAVTYNDSSHTSVTYNFAKGIEYKIPTSN